MAREDQDGNILTISTPIGKNTMVDVEKTITWANSAAVNTYQDVTFPIPVLPQSAELAVIHVRNPSTVTALTVIVDNVEILGGAARDCEITRVTVNANTTRAFVVQGWLRGSGPSKLSVGNNTALGVADTFTAQIRVRLV